MAVVVEKTQNNLTPSTFWRVGLPFGTKNSAPQETQEMSDQSTATLIALPTNALQRIVDEFVSFLQSYPAIVDEFLGVFNQRANTAGYEESAYSGNAMSVVIRAMVVGGATERDLKQAQTIAEKTTLLKRATYAILPLSHQEYLRHTSGELGLLFAVENDVIDDFMSHVRDLRQPMTTVILAMHLEYIRKRDWIV
jgi:hypothetical protein